jgi:hypothetical protein
MQISPPVRPDRRPETPPGVLGALVPWLGGVGLLAMIVACSPPLAPEIPASQATDVVSLRRDDKPELITITRDGDPVGGLAFVAVHGGESRVSRALAAHLQAALVRRGLESTTLIFTGALAVRVAVTPATLPVVFRALHESLTGRAAAELPTGPVVSDACGVRGQALTLGTALRRIGVASSAFGIVGSSDLVSAATAAHAALPAFSPGLLARDPAASEDVLEMTAGTSKQQTLMVALRTSERSRAPSTARLLAEPQSTFRLLAGSFGTGWTLRATRAIFQPGFACVTAELDSVGSHSAHAAGVAAHALIEEARHMLKTRAAQVDVRVEALEASDPRDAATRAAWEALTTRLRTDGDSAFAHFTGDNDPAAFRAGFASRAGRDLPLTEQIEHGQGRIWVYLGRPCAAGYEDISTAGHTGMMLLAAARSAALESELEVSPAYSEIGMGLVASIPTREPYAEVRLADGLVRALLTQNIDANATREQLSGQLVGAETWQLALKLASGGRPSLLDPLAAGTSLSGFGVSSAQRMRSAFLNGPLELRVLANRAGQGAEIRNRVSHLLRAYSGNGEACPETPPVALHGEYSAPVTGEANAVLLFSIPADSLDVARLVANWLNLPGGWFDRSLVLPGLAAGVSASVLGWRGGAAAFVVTLHGWENAPSDAVMQTRALLQRLAHNALEPADQALLESLSGAPRAAADPIQRLLGTSPSRSPQHERVHEFLQQQLTDAHLTLVLSAPKAAPTN